MMIPALSFASLVPPGTQSLPPERSEADLEDFLHSFQSIDVLSLAAETLDPPGGRSAESARESETAPEAESDPLDFGLLTGDSLPSTAPPQTPGFAAPRDLALHGAIVPQPPLWRMPQQGLTLVNLPAEAGGKAESPAVAEARDLRPASPPADIEHSDPKVPREPRLVSVDLSASAVHPEPEAAPMPVGEPLSAGREVPILHPVSPVVQIAAPVEAVAAPPIGTMAPPKRANAEEPPIGRVEPRESESGISQARPVNSQPTDPETLASLPRIDAPPPATSEVSVAAVTTFPVALAEPVSGLAARAMTVMETALVRNVALQISTTAEGGLPQGQVREVVLAPPELGRLGIRLEHNSERPVLVVNVEREVAFELLRRHLPLLEAELRQFGQQGPEVRLESGEGGYGAGRGSMGHSRAPLPEAPHPGSGAAFIAFPALPDGLVSRSSGLDLRL